MYGLQLGKPAHPTYLKFNWNTSQIIIIYYTVPMSALMNPLCFHGGTGFFVRFSVSMVSKHPTT